MEAIKQQQALVQEATSFTLGNSRVAFIVRLPSSAQGSRSIMIVLLTQ